MDNKEINQVEWNLSSALIAEIQSLLSISSKLYLVGNLKKAFWSLKAVKFRFIQSLNNDERKKLRDIEKDFDKSINNKNKTVVVVRTGIINNMPFCRGSIQKRSS